MSKPLLVLLGIVAAFSVYLWADYKADLPAREKLAGPLLEKSAQRCASYAKETGRYKSVLLSVPSRDLETLQSYKVVVCFDQAWTKKMEPARDGAPIALLTAKNARLIVLV